MTSSKATSRIDLSHSTWVKQLVNRMTGLKAPRGEGIIRAEIEIDPIDPLDWLAAQDFDTRLYWRDRETGAETAGVGAADSHELSGAAELADELNGITDLLSNTGGMPSPADGQPRYFGGLPFDRLTPEKMTDPNWHSFGRGWFVLPRFELACRGDRTFMTCNLLTHDLHEKQLNRLFEDISHLRDPAPTVVEHHKIPAPMERIDVPSQNAWNQNIRHVLESFASGRIQKIVMARRSEFSFDRSLDHWRLLRCLRETAESSYLFGVQREPGSAFVGASPERLYRRKDRRIETEALAGTRPRGKDDDEDRRLADELSRSEKDLHEHEIVAQAVQTALSVLCKSPPVREETYVRKLACVQHLFCGFMATLLDNVTDSDLLQTLHPTPAVNGSPHDSAMEHIRRLEQFDRGWYAGPIGWLGRDEAEFAVAIRSGLVTKEKMILYSGAGIVEGSTAEGEWAEIENKIGHFIHAMT